VNTMSEVVTILTVKLVVRHFSIISCWFA